MLHQDMDSSPTLLVFLLYVPAVYEDPDGDVGFLLNRVRNSHHFCSLVRS